MLTKLRLGMINKYLRFGFIIGFFITLFIMEGTFWGKIGLSLYYNDFKIFDMILGYTPTYVYSMLNHVTSSGIHRLLCIDFIFICCFTVVQCIITNYIIPNADTINKSTYVISYLPLIRSTLDIIENIMIIAILICYPSQLPLLVIIASIVTSIKLVLIPLWILGLIYVRIIYIKK